MNNDDQLNIIRLTSTHDSPHVLVLAGIHGDEFEPVIAVHQLVELLSDKLIKGRVSMVPVANPSAMALKQREGEDGKDLARAFPGNVNGSMTEKLAKQLTELIRGADYLIDLHTGGKLFDIFPLAGYLIHDNPEVLEKQRLMARAFNLPLVWGTEASIQGRTLSSARDLDVPAIYAEYRGGAGINDQVIDAYKDGCYNLLQFLGMIAESVQAVNRVCYTIEDNNSGSGNLQSKMPSPADGLFQACVKPGQFILEGELWGRIFNPTDGRSLEILSPESGMALFTRISAGVRTGDSLGGILRIDQLKNRDHG